LGCRRGRGRLLGGAPDCARWMIDSVGGGACLLTREEQGAALEAHSPERRLRKLWRNGGGGRRGRTGLTRCRSYAQSRSFRAGESVFGGGIHVIWIRLTTTVEDALALAGSWKERLIFGLTHNYTGYPWCGRRGDIDGRSWADSRGTSGVRSRPADYGSGATGQSRPVADGSARAARRDRWGYGRTAYNIAFLLRAAMRRRWGGTSRFLCRAAARRQRPTAIEV